MKRWNGLLLTVTLFSSLSLCAEEDNTVVRASRHRQPPEQRNIRIFELLNSSPEALTIRIISRWWHIQEEPPLPPNRKTVLLSLFIVLKQICSAEFEDGILADLAAYLTDFWIIPRMQGKEVVTPLLSSEHACIHKAGLDQFHNILLEGENPSYEKINQQEVPASMELRKRCKKIALMGSQGDSTSLQAETDLDLDKIFENTLPELRQ